MKLRSAGVSWRSRPSGLWGVHQQLSTPPPPRRPRRPYGGPNRFPRPHGGPNRRAHGGSGERNRCSHRGPRRALCRQQVARSPGTSVSITRFTSFSPQFHPMFAEAAQYTIYYAIWRA